MKYELLYKTKAFILAYNLARKVFGKPCFAPHIKVIGRYFQLSLTTSSLELRTILKIIFFSFLMKMQIMRKISTNKIFLSKSQVRKQHCIKYIRIRVLSGPHIPDISVCWLNMRTRSNLPCGVFYAVKRKKYLQEFELFLWNLSRKPRGHFILINWWEKNLKNEFKK